MVTKKHKDSKAREASNARKVRKAPESRTEGVLSEPSFAEVESMPDPTTILDYAARQRDDAMLAVAAAQRQLGEAQSAIAAESENLAQATGAFSDLNKQADETRKKLAAAPTSADGAALLEADANVIATKPNACSARCAETIELYRIAIACTGLWRELFTRACFLIVQSHKQGD